MLTLRRNQVKRAWISSVNRLNMKKETKKKIILTTFTVSGVGAFVWFVLRHMEKKLEDYKSKYYTYADMMRSSTAERLGLRNYTDDKATLLNMKALFRDVLDPLCDKLGKRVTISSGFRTKELNEAISGSSATSQHMKGEAADLDMGSKEANKVVYDTIKALGNYDQLINESDLDWVHVSWKRLGLNRHQELKL